MKVLDPFLSKFHILQLRLQLLRVRFRVLATADRPMKAANTKDKTVLLKKNCENGVKCLKND